MERIPNDLLNDIPVQVLYDNLEDNTCESDVEYAWRFTFKQLSNKCRIRVLKATVPKSRGCQTDGVITLDYPGRGERCCIQEVKYRQSKTPKYWKNQLLQALMYEWMFEQVDRFYNFTTYILNTEDIFVYMFREDVDKFRKTLWNSFITSRKKGYSPSSIHENSDIQNIIFGCESKFHIKEIESDFKLKEEFKRIIKYSY